ncbi:hypothetical protein D6777_01710 [Candidatus Woesearchaeota archaeon]|nr:MAG: hypothetical protein D6777_01710 [Candidatus Woesearchaeota archaeon]
MEWLKTKNVVILLIVTILLASSVLAINGCCEKTKSGDYCIETDDSNCAIESGFKFAPTSCESTSFCKLGCGYSSDTGRCYSNTPRSACEAEANCTYSDSPNCEIPQCQKGCCIIGDQAFFVTQVQCKKTASLYPGVSMNFKDDIKTEVDCIDQTKSQEVGCCVQEDKCVFTTRGNCPSASSSVTSLNATKSKDKVPGFYKDMLCSNDQLNCGCTKQHDTGCVGEDVYWFDSCGNRENIYDADRKKSYNDGFVLAEKDSCKISGAYDPNCGNCDFPSSTVCGKDDKKVMPVGSSTCVSLGCKDVYADPYSPNSGGDKKNGESWCLYDSDVGLARDKVGSRFYKQLCINGEVQVEPCKDYREEICVQGVLGEDVLRNYDSFMLAGAEYTEAACRPNRWQDCSYCNDLTKLTGMKNDIKVEQGKKEPSSLIRLKKDCCNNEFLRDCVWLESGITDAGGVCVPMVPPGLKHWGSASATSKKIKAAATSKGASSPTPSSSAAQVCAKANTECKVVYRVGGWKNTFQKLVSKSERDEWLKKNAKVVQNAECLSKKWVIAGNNYCKAQGDCGAYFNILGVANEPNTGYINTLTFETTFRDGEKFALDENDYNDWQTVINKPSNKKTSKTDDLVKDASFWVGVAGIVTSGVMGAVASSKKGESWYKGFGKGMFGGISALTSLGKKCAPKTSKSKTPEKSTQTKKGEQNKVTNNPNKITNNQNEFTKEKNNANIDSSSSPEPGVDINLNQNSNVAIAAVGIDSITGNAITSITGFATPKVGARAPDVKTLYPKPAQEVFNKLGAGASNDICGKGFSGKSQSIYGSAGIFGSILNLISSGLLIYTGVEHGRAKDFEVTYQIQCLPWQAPPGSTQCEECNNNPYKPCSEYRCKSLGQNCELVNAGTGNESCVSIDPNDVNSPIITPDKANMLPLTIEETSKEGSKGFKINEKIKAFSPVVLAFTTNEPAQCKYSINEGTKFDKMPDFFGTSLYLYNHTLAFSMPSLLTNPNLTKGNYKLYVRCQDAHANKNERDYFIEFSTDPSPDLTPPLIQFTSLADKSFIGFNQTELKLSIYVNEPSTCKWSRRDTGYDLMENEFDCATQPLSQTSKYPFSYECTTYLANLTNRVNNFFFKCRDKPSAPEEDRNTNEESYPFTIVGSKSPLQIESASPVSKTFYTNKVTLEAKTIGGAENGKAWCAFANDNLPYDQMVAFSETGSTTSKQLLEGLPPDSYNFYVRCKDSGANEASAQVNFTVDIDLYEPEIISLTYDEFLTELNIKLDEEATCEYLTTPGFRLGEGTRFSSTNSTTQIATLDPSQKTLYVQCKDKFGNSGEYKIINLVEE